MTPKDPNFWNEFVELMHNYSGRPAITRKTYQKSLVALKFM